MVERYAYTLYGEVTILDLNFSAVLNNVSAISNEHLYTGRRRDPETGLQLNRNRFYASHLGRWVNRDPIGYDGGINLYGYVLGRPTYYVDPSGFFPGSTGHLNPLKPCPKIAKCGKCPDEKEYDSCTQCCEDGEVVSKVPIWVCKRPLDLAPWQVGIVDFCQLDHLPGTNFDVAHSYVCCSGPNMNCYGKQSTCKAGMDIPREMLATGKCKKKMVCPSEKKNKCEDPFTKKNYSIPGCAACHEWANR